MQDSTIAVIAFPGSNCERETALVIERSGMRAHHYYNCGENLAQFDAYVIVGVFL